ncbi:helix-turn-helix transcriptional regulator [Flammeovirga sp. SubArs3]|uniref:helix-turn-helix transcriptional regulator n=1 Tax=Flammeovirga sp. SubArs3 TaxID=2995316 RepID=UPI00248B066D|nr:helix-turn-helix transcriptional regulator [Flammeovirga sp. SubArs3]
MELNIKDGSAFEILSQVHEKLGGELTEKKYEVHNELVDIVAHQFILIRGSNIMVNSVNTKEDLNYNVIGDTTGSRFINFRFEYNADLIRNTSDLNEEVDFPVSGIAIYDTSYSFKTFNKKDRLNQWVSLRIERTQINGLFYEFERYLDVIFPEGQQLVRYDIVPLEMHLLLKDIFDLNLDERTPVVNSIILSRLIECLGIFYQRSIDKHYKATHNLHPDDLKQLMEMKDTLINPYKPLPSLANLAEGYGYSLSKLKRDFSSVFGSSIKKFHTDLRLEMAKQLLQNENRSITEVSRMVGYNSVSKFSAAFKKSYQISPKEASTKYQKK